MNDMYSANIVRINTVLSIKSISKKYIHKYEYVEAYV